MTKSLFAAIAAAILSASPVHAQQAYLGATIAPGANWHYRTSPGSPGADEKVLFGKLYGGYAFNETLALEGGFGAYEKRPGAELRAACDQLLGAQRESGYRFRLLGKKCAGIKFAYRLAEVSPQVLHRDAAGVERALPVREMQPFENNTMGLYRVAVYRFADWPADGTVMARSRPLALGTLYE